MLKESSVVPSKVDDPFDSDSYHETSGSLHEDLLAILSHNGPIYNQDNISLYTNV